MTLKQFILHQLREMQREVLAAFKGLSDEQLTTTVPGHPNHIAWIVQHCCINVDFWLHRQVTGHHALSHDQRFMEWPSPPPRAGEPFPSSEQLCERWKRVTDAGMAAIASLDDAALQASGPALGEEAMVESCLRVINHQNAHLRQIWMILGALGLSETRWPRQETWLANA